MATDLSPLASPFIPMLLTPLALSESNAIEQVPPPPEPTPPPTPPPPPDPPLYTASRHRNRYEQWRQGLDMKKVSKLAMERPPVPPHASAPLDQVEHIQLARLLPPELGYCPPGYRPASLLPGETASTRTLYAKSLARILACTGFHYLAGAPILELEEAIASFEDWRIRFLTRMFVDEAPLFIPGFTRYHQWVTLLFEQMRERQLL